MTAYTTFKVGDKVRSSASILDCYDNGEVVEVRENSLTIVWFKWGYVKPEDRTPLNIIRDYAYRRGDEWFDGNSLLELVESAKEEITINVENLTDKMQFVINFICENLSFNDGDMEQYNITLRTLKALQSRGIIDIDIDDYTEDERNVFCDFTTEAHKYYVNHSEVYANNSYYDANGNTKVRLPARKEESPEPAETKTECIDMLEPIEVSPQLRDQYVHYTEGDIVSTPKGQAIILSFGTIPYSTLIRVHVQYLQPNGDYTDEYGTHLQSVIRAVELRKRIESQDSEHSELRYASGESVEFGDSVLYNGWVGWIIGFVDNCAVFQPIEMFHKDYLVLSNVSVDDLILLSDQSEEYATYLDLLEGQEVLSIEYASCVGVSAGKIWSYGKCINAQPTLDDLKRLFAELFANEFGY